jgi:uncharacterized membrane protein
LSNFEGLLGARGLALLGVIILIVGIATFLKFAYDQGWFGGITPALRCLLAGGFGLGLIGVGEVLRRRINPLASSGVSAAGVATVYASVLAAAKLYELLAPAPAFALLVLVTIGGVLLGVLSSRVMLALLSLVGAFAAPVLLATGEPSYIVMPTYLLALLALGLVLAGWRGGAFAHVRRLAWWGTAIVGSLWAASTYDDAAMLAPVGVIGFAALVWLATVAELVASARFFTIIRDRRGDWPDDARAGFVRTASGAIAFQPRALFSPEARWLNALFGVSAWSAAVAAITLREHAPAWDFAAPLGLGLASVAAGAVVLAIKPAGVARLFATQSSPRSALAAALTINAALLGVATIATAFGGWVQIVAWTTIGVAAIETGRLLRFRAATIFGLGLIGIATARLASLDLLEHLTMGDATTVLGLAFGAWSAQVALVAAAAAVCAVRARRWPERVIGASAAMWLLAATPVHPDSALDALGALAAVIAAAGVWIAFAGTKRWADVDPFLKTLPTNALTLAGVGAATASVSAGMAFDVETSAGIAAAPFVVIALAWAALAALPGAGYALRTSCAALAVGAGIVAIGDIMDASRATALLALSVYAGVVGLAGLRLVRWSVAEIAGGVVVLAAAAWAAWTVSLDERMFMGPPIAHEGFLPAIFAAVSAVFVGVTLPRLARPEDADPGLPQARRVISAGLLALAWVVLLASTSIEAVRTARATLDDETARGAAVSIWWSVFAIASLVGGFRLGAPLRWAGLGLLGVVAAKVLLVDTVTLSTPARIVAAMVVGLLTIGAGVLYARVVDRLGPDDAEPGSTSGDEPARAAEPGSTPGPA